jgi:hypothetical protein
MSAVSRNSIANAEEEQLKRQGRVLLYAIALLHLLCLSLLKQSPPPPAHASSRYAMAAVSVESIG